MEIKKHGQGTGSFASVTSIGLLFAFSAEKRDFSSEKHKLVSAQGIIRRAV